MTFKKSVSLTPHLQDAWLPGLQALRATERPHIMAAEPRQFKGSVDLDDALKNQYPHANRWDFAIAYRHRNRQSDCVYWVEIHAANDNGVTLVLKKLEWLKEWLTAEGQPLRDFERDFIWVSSGATSFTLTSPQVKRFAELGLQHTGRVLRIPLSR